MTTGPTRRRALAALGGVALASLAADPAAAHAGTTHAGTPHWVLLFATLLGATAVAAGWALMQDDETSTRLGAGLAVAGVLATIAGGIGLVEIQIAPRSTPDWTRWFPLINLAAGITLALGSLIVGRLRWPDRPRYTGLGFLLSCWIVYPAVMPNDGLSHPLGYLLAAAVPAAVVYVLRRDAGDAVAAVLGRRTPKVVGAVAFALFSVFFVVSAGSLTFHPELGPDMATEGFVTGHSVASPLVYWPAAEFYVPAIPLAGYVSAGTVLLVGLLGGLVAANAAMVTRQVSAADGEGSPRTMIGAVAASGATACCCCAPAAYGAAGVLFGAGAAPVYWAFMDPTSPVGGLFLAASVLFLTGSLIRASADPACRVPVDDRAPAADVAGD